MPSLPLPFVATIALAILFARMWMIGRQEPVSRGALLFVGVSVLTSTLVGLRWQYDWTAVRLLQPIVASTAPLAAWLAYAELARGRALRLRHVLPHLAPLVVVILCVMLWRDPIDLVLLIEFCGYGIALIHLSRRGPDALGSTRLDEAGRAANAMTLVGLLLVATGLHDLLVSLDFSLFGGAHAPALIAAASLVAVALAAVAIAMVGRSVPADDGQPAGPEATPDTGTDRDGADDQRVLDHVTELMKTRRLFLDPDLTLDRLARRAGVPARQISMAVNRIAGCNVSQWVNGFRIDEAKLLLATTDLPVTAVMLDSGFQTKSNFNREFRRLTGMSPGDYRGTASPARSSDS